jgi:Xaa-Pro aminopeptidase
MQVLDRALVVGPYDWHEEATPRAEYAARLEAARQAMARRGANALLVYGDTFDNGPLAWLANFTPKLGQAVAVFPAAGEAVVFFSGGGLMVESTRRLTWIGEVRAIKNLEKDLAGVLRGAAGAGDLALAVWESGRMTEATRAAIARALPAGGRRVEMQAELEALRRTKSAREVATIRQTCAALAAAMEALRSAQALGAGRRTAALAAERAAYAYGAQDARVLVSARPGGPALALDGTEDAACDPLLASVAVRDGGYWAEARVTATGSENALAGQARAALGAVLRAARPGATAAALERVADAALGPAKRNRALAVFHGVGLSLAEAPGEMLAAGDVCSFQVEVQGEAGARAASSAMALVSEGGVEVLWE